MKAIESEKIETCISERGQDQTQSTAAAVAGFSEKTANRIDNNQYRTKSLSPSSWQTRPDPYNELWTDIEIILNINKNINIIDLFKLLKERHPNQLIGSYRTLQRRVKKWREVNNPTHPSILKRRSFSKNTYEEDFEWMHKLSQADISKSELINQFSNKLTHEEIFKLLDYILYYSISYRNKTISILAHIKGIPNSRIEKFLRVSSRTIRRYIQKYEKDGITESFNYSRKDIKKSQDSKYADKVFEILHSPPSTYGINRTSWKMIDIHRLMNEAGLKIALGNIRKIIRNAGFRVRAAKKVLTSTDPDYKEKLQAITKILSNLGPNDKFFSIDEYGPFSVKVQGGKMLMPPGEINIVPQYQKSKGTLIITAAIELSTNQVIHFYSDKKNTEEMIKLLNILLEKYSNEECIYLSWDAASWHASQALYKKVEQINSPEYKSEHKSPIVKLAPLPAGAQFLNIIESIFSGMSRAIIHNSDYESLDKAKGAIDLYFLERNRHFKDNPKRAGNKIWGKERVVVEFCESNNCKDPNYR